MYYGIRSAFVDLGGGGDVEEETQWHALILENLSSFIYFISDFNPLNIPATVHFQFAN